MRDVTRLIFAYDKSGWVVGSGIGSGTLALADAGWDRSSSIPYVNAIALFWYGLQQGILHIG